MCDQSDNVECIEGHICKSKVNMDIVYKDRVITFDKCWRKDKQANIDMLMF